MKFAFIGDYSGINNAYKRVLQKRGHTAILISEGDGYKNYPRDVNIQKKEHKSFAFKLMDLVLSLLGLKGILHYYNNKHKFKDFENMDAIFVVNPIAIESFGVVGNYLLFKKLRKKNKKIFLQAVGDDYYWVKYCLERGFDYSPLSSLALRNIHKHLFSLRYVFGIGYRRLNIYCANNFDGVVAGLIDYLIPYSFISGKLYFLPFCVLEEDICKESAVVLEKFKGKLVVFNSWQRGKELRKGNNIFDLAAKLVEKDRPDDIEYVVTKKNLPYDQYINLLDRVDIVFDQCFSQDRGMTAIYAMAKGKVVFSGWGEHIFKYYEGDNINAAISAAPSVTCLYDKMIDLIENREKISRIKINAITFIRKNHSEDIVYSKINNMIKSSND